MMMQKRNPLTKGINLIDVLYDHNTATTCLGLKMWLMGILSKHNTTITSE